MRKLVPNASGIYRECEIVTDANGNAVKDEEGKPELEWRGPYYERPWVDGKRTWRSLETENLAHARKEFFRRSAGVTGARADGITAGEVIRRYVADGCKDSHRQRRPAITEKKEIRYSNNLLPFWDKIDVAKITNATCDRYCDWRIQQMRNKREALRKERNADRAAKGLKPLDPEKVDDRDGTRAVDLDLNTLSNAFSWGMRVDLVSKNPIEGRPLYRPTNKVKHCREAMPANADEFHKLAGLMLSDAANKKSEVLGMQTIIEGITGLRTCEVRMLRMDARPGEPGYMSEDGQLCVRRGKGQHAVNPFVVLGDERKRVVLAHHAWHALRYPNSPWWFPSAVDPMEPIGEYALAHALPRYWKAIGKRITSHGLRAFYVLVRRSQGATDAQIAAEIGHTTGGSTIERVYGGVPESWLKGGCEPMSWLPKTETLAWETLSVIVAAAA